MNYFSCLIFLISLSSLSLFTLILVIALDWLVTAAKQKIKMLKINLIMIGVASLIFVIFKLSSWQVLHVDLVDQIMQQSLVHVPTSTIALSSTSWLFDIFIMYSIGFLIMLLRIVFAYAGAKKILTDSLSILINEQTVFINKYISSPLSFGFPKAKIYFPENYKEKWSARETELILAHEKSHLENNDSCWKLFSLLIQAILFFAPWVYLLHKKLELEMEIYCDEKTRTKTKSTMKEYGQLLLAMTCAQPKYLAFTYMRNSTLKRRLLAMRSKTKKYTLLVSILSITLILTGGTTLAAANTIVEKQAVFDIASTIWIDGKLISNPHIIAHENQLASIVLSNKDGSNQLRMDLLASSEGTNSIKMNFDVQYKNGKETLHTKPQLIAAPNQENKIIITNSGHSYEMLVIAKRDR